MLTRELEQLKNEQQYSLQESLVETYKSEGISKELIAQYKPFLDSYMALFKYGALHLDNRSIRIFVSKFIGGSKNEKRRYASSIKYAKSKKDSSSFALSVINKISKLLDKEEIYNHLLITLLLLAKRYIKKESNFTAYLISSFPHELYRQLRHLHIEVALNTQSYHDPNNGDFEMITTTIEKDSHLLLDLDGDLELSNPDWLSGKIANEPFKSMKERERLVLAKYYEPRGLRMMGLKEELAPLVSDREIGQLVGRNRKSIQRVRTRVIKRLEKEWNEGVEEWVKIRNY